MSVDRRNGVDGFAETGSGHGRKIGRGGRQQERCPGESLHHAALLRNRRRGERRRSIGLHRIGALVFQFEHDVPAQGLRQIGVDHLRFGQRDEHRLVGPGRQFGHRDGPCGGHVGRGRGFGHLVGGRRRHHQQPVGIGSEPGILHDHLDLIAHSEAVIRQFDEDAGVGILHGEAAGRNVVHGHHAALYIIVVADRHRFGALHGADGRNIGLHGIVGARTLRLALDFEHDVVEEEAHVVRAGGHVGRRDGDLRFGLRIAHIDRKGLELVVGHPFERAAFDRRTALGVGLHDHARIGRFAVGVDHRRSEEGEFEIALRNAHRLETRRQFDRVGPLRVAGDESLVAAAHLQEARTAPAGDHIHDAGLFARQRIGSVVPRRHEVERDVDIGGFGVDHVVETGREDHFVVVHRRNRRRLGLGLRDAERTLISNGLVRGRGARLGAVGAAVANPQLAAGRNLLVCRNREVDRLPGGVRSSAGAGAVELRPVLTVGAPLEDPRMTGVLGAVAAAAVGVAQVARKLLLHRNLEL